MVTKKLHFGQCWPPHIRTLPFFLLIQILKFKFLIDYQHVPFLTGYQTPKTVWSYYLLKPHLKSQFNYLWNFSQYRPSPHLRFLSSHPSTHKEFLSHPLPPLNGKESVLRVPCQHQKQYLCCCSCFSNLFWFLFCFTLFFPMSTFWRACKDFWTKINSNTRASYWVFFALPGAYYMQRLAKLIWCPSPSLLDCIIWQTLIPGDKENYMKKKTAFHVYWSSSM